MGKLKRFVFVALLAMSLVACQNNNQLSINFEPGINQIQQITEAESKSDDIQSQKDLEPSSARVSESSVTELDRGKASESAVGGLSKAKRKLHFKS